MKRITWSTGAGHCDAMFCSRLKWSNFEQPTSYVCLVDGAKAADTSRVTSAVTAEGERSELVLARSLPLVPELGICPAAHEIEHRQCRFFVRGYA